MVQIVRDGVVNEDSMDARLYKIGKDENVVQLFSFEYCDVLGQVLFLFTILKPSDLGRCSF